VRRGPLEEESVREIDFFWLVFTGIRRISFISPSYIVRAALLGPIIPFHLGGRIMFLSHETKENLSSVMAFSV
jgi:hypothetical protein